MKKVLILVMVLMCMSSYGFDGVRKGFILGVGAGFKNGSYTPKYLELEGEKEKESGFATNFKIGYAPSNDLEIYWSSKVGWFSMYENEAFSGVAGLGITKYLNSNLKSRWEPSVFLSGGIGYSVLQYPSLYSNGERIDGAFEVYTGMGYFIGCGYEFSRHYNIEANLLMGNPKYEDDSDLEFKNTIFMVTINALAF